MKSSLFVIIDENIHPNSKYELDYICTTVFVVFSVTESKYLGMLPLVLVIKKLRHVVTTKKNIYTIK